MHFVELIANALPNWGNWKDRPLLALVGVVVIMAAVIVVVIAIKLSLRTLFYGR
jgi:hypothetical protein